jgi:hypothetical protein
VEICVPRSRMVSTATSQIGISCVTYTFTRAEGGFTRQRGEFINTFQIGISCVT